MDKYIEIDGLTFVMTCSAYPEQYDVFQGAEQVGYVRLRHGDIFAVTPNEWGTEVYHARYRNGDGYFEDDIDRMEHLTEIAEKLNERLT